MQPGEHFWEPPPPLPILLGCDLCRFCLPWESRTPILKGSTVGVWWPDAVWPPAVTLPPAGARTPPPPPRAPHSLCLIPIAKMRHSPVEAAPHQMTLVVVKAAD